MAHASGDPVIDPDDPADSRRLWSERPIILSLAETAIEEFFGVERRSTNYSKHLYELEGFKRIFGDELVGHLIRGDDPDYSFHGMYRFKTGFGGRIVHNTGSWDYPVRQDLYQAFRNWEMVLSRHEQGFAAD